MTDGRELNVLRAKYRSLWDAHQVIASKNARLTKGGKQPSDEQLIAEQQAADDLQLARAVLLTEMAKG